MAKKVLILVASGTKDSRTLTLGKAIAHKLEEYKADAEILDLFEHVLPPYNVTTEKTDAYDDATRVFLEKSKQADGFVWVTPVYHNSFSSIMKTALDWQHFFMDGKVVGLASHGGDRNTVAVDQLAVIARSQHLLPILTRICTENDDYNDQKRLVDKRIQERIERFSKELIDFLTRFGA